MENKEKKKESLEMFKIISIVVATAVILTAVFIACKYYLYDYFQGIKANAQSREIEEMMENYQMPELDDQFVHHLFPEDVESLETVDFGKTDKDVVYMSLARCSLEAGKTYNITAWLLYDDGNCDGNVAKLKKIAGVEPHLFVYTPTYKCNQVPLQIDVSRANILDKNVIVVTHIEEMQKNNQ